MTDDPRRKRLFEQCVEKHSESMYRVAFRLTGCPDWARELVQETYLQAWANIDSLSNPEKMKSWMFAIMRNQYTKLLRRKPKSFQMTEVIMENVASAPPAHPFETDEQQIRHAIGLLNDDHKLPLLLVSMEGMSVDDAATTLQLPRGTVLSRLHRGREKLKNILMRLDSDWEEPQAATSTRSDQP